MATARIDGILAQSADLVVLFRRGPSKLTQQLVWNLQTDEITPGQWIKGRVYTRRCDISSDGRFLVAAITNYSSSHRASQASLKPDDQWMTSGWTALSRPPYFTALGLWFTGGAWNGGGIWRSNRDLALNNFRHGWVEGKKPIGIRTTLLDLPPSEDEPIYSMLLQKRGWQVEQPIELTVINPGYRKRALEYLKVALTQNWTKLSGMDLDSLTPQYVVQREGIWKRRVPNAVFVRIDRSREEQWLLCDKDEHIVREWKVPQWSPHWLEIDARGRILFSERGLLWAWSEFPAGRPTQIADLNGNGFVNIEPPSWALRSE